MRRKPRRSIDEIMEDGALIDAALGRAVREALRRHKLAGVPIVVWRDGRTVHVPPEEIKVPPE
jgi:hypothetical protein